jgi:hypothetical protein
MGVKEYVFKRLEEGEFDLNVLFRQARIQFPSSRIGFAYIRQIRNEWRRATASLPPHRPAANLHLRRYASLSRLDGRMDSCVAGIGGESRPRPIFDRQLGQVTLVPFHGAKRKGQTPGRR